MVYLQRRRVIKEAWVRKLRNAQKLKMVMREGAQILIPM
jgi:hypothetical protein